MKFLLRSSEAFEKTVITAEATSRIQKAYQLERRIYKEVLQIGGVSFGINHKKSQPLKSFQEIQEVMKKPQVNFSQLKAGIGAKLKRKRGPLSPASISSAKKRIAEKESLEVEPSSLLAEKEVASGSTP